MKRLIPFYTWSRKNFPLQLEHMVRKPGKYTRYLHAKRNLELGTEDDGLRPSFFDDIMAIRTGLTAPGGAVNVDGKPASMYATPDLPFTRLTETFNTDILLSQLTPIIKTPMEVNAGKQFFSGIPFRKDLEQAPDGPLWAPILGVLELAGGQFGLPKVERHADGTYMMNEADIYKIEQFLPVLNRSRRLASSEPRMQDRKLTNWLSFVGLNARTNSEREQYGAQKEIEAKLDDLLRRWKAQNT